MRSVFDCAILGRRVLAFAGGPGAFWVAGLLCFSLFLGGCPANQAPEDDGGARVAPAAPSPANKARDVAIDTDLDWTDAGGATSYDVYFGTTNPPPLVGNTATSAWALDTLDYGTTYYWQIVARYDNGSTPGAVWSFSTEPPPPEAPSNPNPATKARDVPVDADLDWADAAGATSYDVYFSTTNPPALVGNTEASAWALGSLSYGTKYYWRVVAKNATGSTAGAVWSFSSQPPPPQAPSNPSPADQADDVSIDADLDWADAAGATSYDVYFGTTDPPPLVGNTPSSAWALGTLSYGTTYYWRVVAKNATGSTAGPVWAFATPPSGLIVTWGANNNGQCNVPGPNAGFIAVATHGLHSLGLKADGSIVAWGNNADGQCNVPAPNRGFVAVAAGWYHSLGLKADGSIVAWGDNAWGQCNVPAPNSGFVAVVAGGGHNLGLKADGSIVAWGRNDEGQCNVPASNSGFVAVAGGGYHSLGLKADGSIVAWGWNADGQCNVPAPNSGFVAVAGGGYNSLGLKADGSIVAWGSNDEGQCNVPAPNSGFEAVAGGGYHSLGLKADGSIVAWGRNAEGQCDVPMPNNRFFAVAGGDFHSLGLRE